MRKLIFSKYQEEYFKKIHGIVNFERRTILKWDLSYLKQKKKGIKRILDIGCGLGEFLEFCDREGIQTFGIENSSFAISYASKNTKAKLFKLDVGENRFPFKDNYFDAVCALDVLEHLETSDFVISEAFRVLAKGGVFLATTPNGDLVGSKIRQKLLPYDPTHINIQNGEFWRISFEKAGFNKFKCGGCLFFGFPPISSLRQKLKTFGIKSYIGPIFFPVKSVCATLYITGYK